MNDIGEKYRAAIYAGIVGDALGVPAELTTHEDGTLCSVKNLLGYGRYDQPAGTWSDDTSLTLCTLESLSKGYDLEDMGRTFCSWLFESRWTPAGYVFDAGLTTFMALDAIRTGKAAAQTSGCATEDDNGNGSLMRILPAALYFSPEPVESCLTKIHEISGITHAHARAKVGCGIYALMVRELLTQSDPLEAYRAAIAAAADWYGSREEFRKELPHYIRVLSGDLPSLHEEDIRCSGYVVDTLESGLWAFLRNANTRDVLLAAVDMGLDTDTTGMVAGGLAGLHYGLAGVPQEWLGSLARREEIDALVTAYVKRAFEHRRGA